MIDGPAVSEVESLVLGALITSEDSQSYSNVAQRGMSSQNVFNRLNGVLVP